MQDQPDIYEIDQKIISSILLATQHSPKHIQTLITWHKSNKPSMAIIKHKLLSSITKNNNKNQVFSRIEQCLHNLLTSKANLGIIRAYLSLLKQHKQELNVDVEKIRPFWKRLSMDHLDIFFEIFGFRPTITEQQLNDYIKQLIKAERYDDCKNLIKVFGSSDIQMHKLLTAMGNNKTASKAADFIKEMKIDQNNYPEINKRLSKKCLRHFLNKEGWEYVEELYEDNVDMIAFAVEDLIYNKKEGEAVYLYCKYLEKGNEDKITKKETVGKIKEIMEGGKYEKARNFLCEKTEFGPSNEKKYLSLKTWGFKAEDVVWIDNNTPDIPSKLSPFFSCKMFGIDTQSIVGLTKLQQPKQGVALIQLATDNYLLLIDCLNLTGQPLQQVATFFRSILMSNEISKVGHTLFDDLKNTCNALKIPKEAENLIDVQKIYKGIAGQKHSNLSHIAAKVLGKEVCKVQTLTNWKRRPLRGSQVHYGCMDAFVVLKIYQQMLNEYGAQYVAYFVDEDELKEEFEYD